MQPDFELPEDEARGRQGPRRQGRPHLHDDLRGAAQGRAQRLQDDRDRAAGRRRHRRGDRRPSSKQLAESARTFSAERRRRRSRRPRDRRPMSARSTASRSPAAPTRTRMIRLGIGPVHSRASRSSSTALKAGDEKTINVTFPADYAREESRRQGGDLRRHGQGSGRARRPSPSTTSWPSASASRSLDALRDAVREQIQSAVRHGDPRRR